jgi:hypothetical protein
MTGGKPSFAASAKIRAHQRASQQGNVASMLAIGDAYYYGRGLVRDWPMAFQVYAAASRFRNAQVHLAIFIFFYIFYIYIYIFFFSFLLYIYIHIYSYIIAKYGKLFASVCCRFSTSGREINT